MDNFGYRNWGNNSNSYNDDSYEESPPATGKYGSGAYGAKKGAAKASSSDFDYDISSDFADSPVADKYSQRGRQTTAAVSSSNRFSSTTTRASIHDRTKEILERNKAVGKTAQDDEDDKRLRSYQDTFKDLMEGLGDRVVPSSAVETSGMTKSFTQSQSRMDSTLDSPGGDSFELSAADLEVGALAARRAKEKAHDRQRRMSLDRAPHTLDQSSFTSMKESSMRAKRGASPDFQTNRKSGDGVYGSMQFGSALSSIQKSFPNEDGDRAGGEFARYGSMNRSDDEIYKMLNVTQGTQDSIKFGDNSRPGRSTAQSSMRGSGPNFTGSSALGLGGKKPSMSLGGGGGGRGGADMLEAGDSYDGDNVSDVSGSSNEDNDRRKKPAYQAAATAQSKPGQPSSGVGAGLGSKNYGSYYSGRHVSADEDGDGDSGDSDKAHSPVSKSSGGYSMSPTGKGGKTLGAGGNSKPHRDEDDEYSLDDFEADGFNSPAKVATAAAKLDAKPVLSSSTTRLPSAPPSAGPSPTPVGPPPYQSKPPSELGLASPNTAKKTLTPTNSTSSMHSASKNTGMNSVEEIMQRWYTADSDFTQRSLQRLGAGDTGFSLDDEDMNPLPAKTTKEGIAGALLRADSAGSFALNDNNSAKPPSGGTSAGIAGGGSVVSARDAMTPSPLTTAAPTPVNHSTGPSPMPSAPVPTGVSGIVQPDSRPSSTNSGYSDDSMHIRDSASEAATAPSAAPAPVPMAVAAPAPVTVVAPQAAAAPQANPFDLSTSYDQGSFEEQERKPLSAFVPVQAPVQPVAQPSSATAVSAPVAAPASVAQPAAVKTEPLKLFGQREGAGSYMSLDMLPTFAPQPEPQVEMRPPQPQPNYHRNPQPDSAQNSVSQSMSPASRYHDTEEENSDGGNYYDAREAASPNDRRGSRQPSKIVPPRIHVRGGNEQSARPQSAPARGGTEARDRPEAPRRMSAATAAKIQQHKALSPEERRKQIKPRTLRQVSASTTRAPFYEAHKQREIEAREAKKHGDAAMSRLAQENWRLNRKYERLEAEVDGLRASQSVLLDESGFAVPPAPKPFLYKHSDGLKDPKSLSGGGKGKVQGPSGGKSSSRGASRERDHQSEHQRDDNYAPNQGRRSSGAGGDGDRDHDEDQYDQDDRDSQQAGASGRGLSSNLPTRQYTSGGGGDSGVKEGWEMHMEAALVQLKEENKKLLEREKAVLVREEAVSIRESTVAMKEKMVGAATAHKTKEENKIDFFVNEELTILREREQDLLRELDRLKASLFVQGQDQAAIADSQLRLSLGLDPTFEIDGSYKPLAKSFGASMHKAGVYPQSVLKPQLKSYYTDKVNNKDKDKGGPDDTVPVNKADYEKLVSDHAAQERLLDAFQKENDRLAKFAKEKDTEQQLRSAVFFDQREGLNKELNRLKNVTRASGAATETAPRVGENASPANFDEIPIPTSKKTAETLRMELQMDATIRALKEQLREAESGMGERERDLQVTIEKLRRDNRELAAIAANVNLQQIQPQDSDYLQLQTENSVAREEIASLKQRVEWYVQNQELLDSAEEENQRYRQVIAALKKELVTHGSEVRAVDRIIHSFRVGHIPDLPVEESPTGNNSAMDRSGVSGLNNRTPTKGRSFADIKKIKELEGVVRDLQDSLRKRHPDSVANLIRAATVSDSVQLQRRQQDQQVEALRQELEDIKAQHEKRLRSLRQEHERIKGQYEKVLSEQQEAHKAGAGESVPSQGLGGFTKGSASSANNVKTLTQALNRIRELEEEMERVRSFYTKKVEDVQRKSEAQIRALKRGGVHTSEDGSPSAHRTNANANAASKEGFPTGNSQNMPTKASASAPEQMSAHVQEVVAMYSERLALLEKELMSTAEELGRVKAAALSSKDGHSQRPSFIPPPGFSAPVVQTPGAHPAHMYAHMPHGMSMHPGYSMPPQDQGQRHEADRAAQEQRVAELKTQHTSHVDQLSAQWASERDSLQKRLRDEEERCATLRQELMSAVRGAAFAPAQQVSHTTQVEMKSPELKQFLQMEAQIDTLEVRLFRREKELMGAVEEAKAAAAIERSRLEAIHAQEVREKDNQLVHFQQELVQLVTALRHWKERASQAEGGANLGAEISSAFPLFV